MSIDGNFVDSLDSIENKEDYFLIESGIDTPLTSLSIYTNSIATIGTRKYSVQLLENSNRVLDRYSITFFFLSFNKTKLKKVQV